MAKFLESIARQALESLCDEGVMVKELDGNGRPLLYLSSVTGKLEQVYKLSDAATPEELEYWRKEHPVS